ncbi:unnamed protein product [Withania somnifera]
MIIAEGNLILRGQFDSREIWNNVQACFGDKAPGPDGFPMIFFFYGCEVVSEDVIAAIQNFHERCVSGKSFNATYVTLIPKKMGAKELTDFRHMCDR